MRLLALTIIFGLFFSFGCKSETESNAPSNGPNAEKPDSLVKESKADDGSLSQQEQIKKILSDYYRALENEDPDIQDFYAPIIEKFYSADSFSREKVQQSLQQSFASVEDRKVKLDWNSIEISETDGQWIVTFKGKTEYIQSASGEKKNAGFFNQLTFDEDLRILKYEDAEKARSVKQQDDHSGIGQLKQVLIGISQALRSGKLERLTPFLHPKEGFFLVTKPGVFSVLDYCTDVSKIGKKAPWLSKGNAQFCKIPSHESLPSYTCEEEFSKQGCFFYPHEERFEDLSQLIDALQRYAGKETKQASTTKAKKVEGMVSHQFIDTSSSLSLHLGQVDGKWYLFVIDLATYDCSA